MPYRVKCIRYAGVEKGATRLEVSGEGIDQWLTGVG